MSGAVLALPRGPGPERLRRVARSRAGWVLLVVVAAAALAVGSVHPAAPSRGARIAALESEIKCPSCADLSIAQSDAAAALDLRSEVTRLVDAGESDAAIEREVVAEYGTAALLAPPASGVNLLVWLVPLLVVVLVAGALGGFLWRRRSRPSSGIGSAEDEALVQAALRGEPSVGARGEPPVGGR